MMDKKKAQEIKDAAKASFGGWDEKNTAIIVEAYQKADVESRNTKETLVSIGKLINYPNDRAVRAKLTNEKIYVKAEKSAGVKGRQTTSKTETRRAVETMLGLKVDSLSTLDKGNRADLELLQATLVVVSAQSNAKKGIKE